MNKLERKTLTIHFDEVYQLQFDGYIIENDYYECPRRHTYLEHSRNGNTACVDSRTDRGTIEVKINNSQKRSICIAV